MICVWRGAEVFYNICGAGSGCIMRVEGSRSVLLYMWCGEQMYNVCGGERMC
jgi:hypothetical protein